MADPDDSPPRYEIGVEIARGGMGRVVEATDTMLGRTVALKEALELDADSRARFAREIRITARLEHPSIVPVHDAGSSAGGAPFYVMRKVDGKPLEKLVAETHTLAERLALIPHVVASANAIAHAHERGIVHRDIKPSNILVGGLGETIVIDWGLANVIGEADAETRAGLVYGTPGFMSPEQLRGAPADERCDVYALGATLYHLLLRRPPHHDGEAKSLVGQIEGVPPDLSTIVDKSLAHDARDRYQNARSLAEDLERFLKGQLIAAHHYTRGDKLKRFIRKNRVPIIGIGIATLAAIVVGAISIVDVVHQRDRADEASVEARHEKEGAVAAREEAEDRADALTLANARALLETNPTLSVALLKRVASTSRWQEVRAIAEGARFAGVAWRSEASTTTRSVRLSKDGTRALTVGNEGVVRMYDLAHHTVAKIFDANAPMRVRFTGDEKRIVLYGGKTLITLDTSGGARRDIALPSAVRDLEMLDDTAYYVDDAGAMFALELSAPAPLQLPLEEGITGVTASPDGHWIALAGVDHLWLLDPKDAKAPHRVFAGKARDITWSASGAHCVAQFEEHLVDVDVTTPPEPTIVRTMNVGARYSAVFANDQVYSLGPLGVETAKTRTSLTPRRQFPVQDIRIHIARNDTVLAASSNAIYALTEEGDRVLLAPVHQIETLDSSPRSPYVVATSEGSLLVWNLDEIQGKSLLANPTSARFTGNDRVLAVFDSAPSQWLDLATGQATQLETSAALRRVASSPSGKAVAVIDVSHHARIVGSIATELDGQIDDAHFVDETRLLLAVSGGNIELYDASTRARTLLLKHGAKVVSMAWNHADQPSVAVAFDDGFLWRVNLSTTKSSSFEIGKKPSSQVGIGDDATVWFGADTELRAWRAGATTAETIAVVPKPITEVALHDNRAVVFTDDGSYLVELASKSVAPLFPLGRHAVAELAGLIAATRGPLLDVIDPSVHARWTIASANDATFSHVEISSDGMHVIALVHDQLMAWTLERPATQAATAKWLDAMTNAYDKGTGELSWR